MGYRLYTVALAAAVFAGMAGVASAQNPYYSPYQPGYAGNAGFGPPSHAVGTLHAYGVPERYEAAPGQVIGTNPPGYGGSLPPAGTIYRPGMGE
jgi:hypothetical protein